MLEQPELAQTASFAQGPVRAVFFCMGQGRKGCVFSMASLLQLNSPLSAFGHLCWPLITLLASVGTTDLDTSIWVSQPERKPEVHADQLY